MQKTIAELSPKEFEKLIERAVDRRLSVWITQLADAVTGIQNEDDLDLQPEFAESLRRALQQAQSGEGIDLQAFRRQVGR